MEPSHWHRFSDQMTVVWTVPVCQILPGDRKRFLIRWIKWELPPGHVWKKMVPGSTFQNTPWIVHGKTAIQLTPAWQTRYGILKKTMFNETKALQESQLSAKQLCCSQRARLMFVLMLAPLFTSRIIDKIWKTKLRLTKNKYFLNIEYCFETSWLIELSFYIIWEQKCSILCNKLII